MKTQIKEIVLTDQSLRRMKIYSIDGSNKFGISINGGDFVFTADEKDELIEAINQITE